MNTVFDLLLVMAWLVSVLASAYNAAYFLGYRSADGQRRLGAHVMAVVSIGTLMESLAFGLLSYWTTELDHRAVVIPWPASSGWLAARLVACLGTVLISLLILRQRLSR